MFFFFFFMLHYVAYLLLKKQFCCLVNTDHKERVVLSQLFFIFFARKQSFRFFSIQIVNVFCVIFTILQRIKVAVQGSSCGWLIESTQSNICVQSVCVCTHWDICFFLSVMEGRPFKTKLCRDAPTSSGKKLEPFIPVVHIPEALTAMRMMIKIIPITSPTTFKVLAVFDASTALAESPMEFALCA